MISSHSRQTEGTYLVNLKQSQLEPTLNNTALLLNRVKLSAVELCPEFRRPVLAQLVARRRKRLGDLYQASR